MSLAEAAARRDPVLVLFEDAHWVDPTSLEVLDALVERVRELPMLLLVTHRPEFSRAGSIAGMSRRWRCRG